MNIALQHSTWALNRWARLGTVVVLCCLVAVLTSEPAFSARTKLIRDAEIESTIRNLATPLLKAAGLAPNDVRIHLVKNDGLNAFVAGGMRIFFYTGLLQNTKSPNELAGVLAHEIGHISGGHLARTRDELRGATATTVLAAVLGVAAAVVSGDGAVGAAVALGGQSAAQRNLLKYSRTQESAADQAALNLLDATGQSARGLQSFMRLIGSQELLLSSQQDPYLRTHPFSRDRVQAIERHLSRSRYTDTPDTAEALRAHRRMIAKLDGFLSPVSRVLAKYPETDTSLSAAYARAVAYHRRGEFERSDREADSLVARAPDDAYFWELLGQVKMERGQIGEAVIAYEKALALSNRQPLITIAYAHAVIQSGDAARLDGVVPILKDAVLRDGQTSSGWRLLATAYGKQGRLGLAALALAEAEWRIGRPKRALQQALRAQQELKKGSGDWLRAEDLRLAAQRVLNR